MFKRINFIRDIKGQDWTLILWHISVLAVKLITAQICVLLTFISKSRHLIPTNIKLLWYLRNLHKDNGLVLYKAFTTHFQSCYVNNVKLISLQCQWNEPLSYTSISSVMWRSVLDGIPFWKLDHYYSYPSNISNVPK